MKKKRTQLEIIHDMLLAVQEKGGRIKPTHLLSKSNLSHKMMQEYLELLEKRGLLLAEEQVADNKGRKVKKKEKNGFVITEKGRKFLFEYKQITAITEAFGL